MKKLLVLIALISCLLPIKAKAESRAYECLDTKNLLVERLDAYTVYCYDDSNLNDKTLPGTTFYLLKWDDQAKRKYTVMISTLVNDKSNRNLISIFEKGEKASFLIKNRQFQIWVRNSNSALVNKHKEDITLLLNAFERYVKLSGTTNF